MHSILYSQYAERQMVSLIHIYFSCNMHLYNMSTAMTKKKIKLSHYCYLLASIQVSQDKGTTIFKYNYSTTECKGAFNYNKHT